MKLFSVTFIKFHMPFYFMFTQKQKKKGGVFDDTYISHANVH